MFVWRALRNFAIDMADVENVQEMAGTREAEAEAVATESGGALATESGGAAATESGGAATTGGETVATAATGGVMFTDEGELEFDENEMAALEGQRLVAELLPDSGSEPDFEGFHVSELAGDLSGGDDSGSEAVTDSDDDDGVTGHLSDAAAAAAYWSNPNLPDFIHPHGPLIHVSGCSAYEIFCSIFPVVLLALMVEETNRYYDLTVAALGGLDNRPPASRLRDRMPVDLPCMKAFLTILILMGVDQRNSYELYWTTIESTHASFIRP